MKTESSQASNTNRHSQPTGGPAMITQHSFRGPIAKLSVALTAALLLFALSLSARAAIVTDSLDIHYRADNTSGTTVTDLAGTQDATMVGDVTVTENSGEASSSPFRYG